MGTRAGWSCPGLPGRCSPRVWMILTPGAESTRVWELSSPSGGWWSTSELIFPAAAGKEGAREMALYANICQRNGSVPIIEPDISRDGDHDVARSLMVSETVLSEVYSALAQYSVYLEGTVLKPSMVTSGTRCQVQAAPDQVAHLTLLALSRHVPAAVPGIFFLSGGQTEQMATENLMAINTFPGSISRPWVTSFCYGRALQDSCRAAWLGLKENEAAAREAFMVRVKANGEAAAAKPL